MRLYEFVAKGVFRDYGIPIPEGFVVSDVEDLESIKDRLNFPVVIKAQVLAGGRGRAGGVRFAEDIDEARKTVEEMLGSEIKGNKVRKVLIEEKLKVEKEYYVGFTIDRSVRSPILIASESGGMDIEDVARSTPEKIVKTHIDITRGLHPHKTILMMKRIGLSGKLMLSASDVVQRLYRIFRDKDAELTEINPLALTDKGFIALDARLNIDENALYRHPEFDEYKNEERGPLEIRAREADLSYVELNGNIGIMGNGAGLVMATIDTIELQGGKAANFCDLGGGSPQEKVLEGIDIILSNPRVKGVFANILGGITRCDDVARALIEYKKKNNLDIPFVVRLMGTNEEEARKICANEKGIELVTDMIEGVKRIVEIVDSLEGGEK